MPRFHRRSLISLGLAFLAFWSALLAYYRIFTGFAEWDDEGTQMMPIRQYLDGGTLYENVRTGYGPVYYFFNRLLRIITATAVTHDVTRITSMVIWMLCAMACAWLVWKWGRSLAIALVTHLLVFRALAFFCNEPGHPQELCMMLLIALVAGSFAADSPRLRLIALVTAGAMPAALLLVKVNIGIFAILAVALALSFHVPQGRLVTLVRVLAGAASLVLPALLMRAHLGDSREIAYCAAITAGVAALLTGAIEPVPLFSYRDCVFVALSFLCACGIVFGILFAEGVAPATLLTSLVLSHLHMSVLQGDWYLAMDLSPWWILWALCGSAIALYLASRRKAGSPWTPPAPVIAVCSVIALILAAIGPRGILVVATPFCWVVACRRADFPRTLLAWLATLQTLYAYPIAGSQAPFTNVLLIVVAAVCLSDALRECAPQIREAIPARPVAAAIVCLVLLSYPVQVWRARNVYRSQTPLDLPGTGLVRIEPREAAAFTWLVRELKRNCDTFVAYPGVPSLHFWTGLPMPGPVIQPPGPLNSGQWTDLFSPAQQQSIVDEFARHPNGCVVYHPSGIRFWNRSGVDQGSLPLVHYVQDNFKTVGAMDDYQLQVRKDRTWIPAPQP